MPSQEAFVLSLQFYHDSSCPPMMMIVIMMAQLISEFWRDVIMDYQKNEVIRLFAVNWRESNIK